MSKNESVSDEEKAMMEAVNNLKKSIRPFVQEDVKRLFQESISGKIVVSALNLVGQPGQQVWTTYACLEHATGVKILPVQIGTFYPDIDLDALRQLGYVIVVKPHNALTPGEAYTAWEVLTECVKDKFGEGAYIRDSDESYVNSCCLVFPGEVTSNQKLMYERAMKRKEDALRQKNNNVDIADKMEDIQRRNTVD